MANAEMTARAVLEARDRTGNTFATVGAKAGRAANALGRVNGSARAAGRGMMMLNRVNQATTGALLASTARFVAPAAMAYGAAKSYTGFAKTERQLTRIGITADASRKELSAMGRQARGLADDVSMPFDEVVTGYDALAAQGKTATEIMAMMPAIARTAQASGAGVDDMANSAGAVGEQMKIAASEMQNAFDIMVQGGKAGKFELRDMARYLPSLAPLAASIGMTGTAGLEKLVTMAQVVRSQTGTAEEAASSLQNVFAKMESDATAKKFSKFGIDLRKEMKAARAGGKDLLETFINLSRRAMKGDMSLIPQLFPDMELARGMRALLTAGDVQKQVAADMKNAAGATGRDLEKILSDQQAQLDRLSNSWTNLGNKVGETMVSLGASYFLDNVTKGLGVITDEVDRYQKGKPTRTEEFIKNPGGVVDITPEAHQAYADKAQRDRIDARREQLQARVDQSKRRADAYESGNAPGPLNRNRKFENEAQTELDELNQTVAAHDNAALQVALAEKQNRDAQRIHQVFKPESGYAPSFQPLATGAIRSSFPLTKSLLPAGTVLPTGPGTPDVPAPVQSAPAAVLPPGARVVSVEEALGGKLEAVVKPDQVTAKIDGSAQVDVKVDITVSPSGKLLDVAERSSTSSSSSGHVSVTGAGNVGTSAPERE